MKTLQLGSWCMLQKLVIRRKFPAKWSEGSGSGLEQHAQATSCVKAWHKPYGAEPLMMGIVPCKTSFAVARRAVMLDVFEIYSVTVHTGRN